MVVRDAVNRRAGRANSGRRQSLREEECHSSLRSRTSTAPLREEDRFEPFVHAVELSDDEDQDVDIDSASFNVEYVQHWKYFKPSTSLEFSELQYQHNLPPSRSAEKQSSTES